MPKRILTPASLRELLKRYPHENNAALAAAFGISASRVAVIGSEHGVKKTKATISASASNAQHHANSLCHRIVAAVKASGARGMTLPNIQDLMADTPKAAVSAAVRGLTRRGSLHRAGPLRLSRYFTDAGHAAQHQLRVPNPKATTAPLDPLRARTKPASTPGDPVITDSTRKTVCYSVFDPAFATPAPPPAPHRYLTGDVSPWVAALTARQ